MSIELPQAAKQLDEQTIAFYFEVPRGQIVLLQAYFELYEGVGTVTTIEGERALVCVLTTPSLQQDCMGVLHAIQEQVTWRAVLDTSSINHSWQL
jgi:hypothetical protein